MGQKEDEYEIVNCLSTYVFDEESNEIRLKFGKQNADQLFSVVDAGDKHHYWIKTSAKGDKALKL
jgi:hypothetical protein